jgi:hypothetical protein
MSDIHMKSVSIPHPDTGKIVSLLNILGQMTALKTKSFKHFKDILAVL